ncbi:ste20-like kinase [Brevipalpus obovatus]|uniref:ste20-like kinase n=1 Tax=Brevipalpus obovatus TaxID=246614 RepID=UPI003D9ED519
MCPRIMDYPSSLSINLFKCDPSAYSVTKKIDDKVHQGEYTTSKLIVAIKMYPLDELNDTEISNIKEGVRLTRLLRHENVLPYLACFLNDHLLWIVTPYCAHGSSSELSKPAGLSEKAISFIVRDVLNALEYIHGQGIIHRAVRGQHILIYGPQGKCLLTGFQYATSVVDNGRYLPFIHQYPSNAKPNLNWLSPELLEQNLLGYNSKSDIYSLGVTCCELANGCVPFANLQPTEMLLDKLTGNFPKPIDSTCNELKEMFIGDLSPEEREKYDTYRGRRFSEHFHSFTEDMCLLSDPHKRPSASQLLNHKFIKQLKKLDAATNLLSVLR